MPTARQRSLSAFEARARRLRKLTQRYPRLRPVVDRAGMAVWKLQLARNAPKLIEGAAEPIQLDPADVRLALWRLDLLEELGLSSQRELVGRVEGGDWDTKVFPLSDLTFFEAVEQHYNAGVAWGETRFYREIAESLDAGVPKFKYRSHADVPRQQERIEQLYRSMQSDGFRSQSDLGTLRPWDEIVVAFDRVGRVVFVNGRHRLAIARTLDIDSVSAVVGLRHKQWVQHRAEIAAYVERSDGVGYQPLMHPDLAFIPSKKGDDRLPMVVDALPPAPATVVDIGANKGYFCHSLERRGYRCTAIERSAKEAYFLHMIRDANQDRFEIVHGAAEAFDWSRSVDVVLALNVFHHFLKTEASWRNLEVMLGRIEAGAMIFEPHLADDPQMRNAYRNLAPDAFVAFVLEHSAFDTSRCIGVAADGRPLYHLSRSS